MRGHQRAANAAITQHSHADHNVWLMKCAPRTHCAQPKAMPRPSTASNATRAVRGLCCRQRKYTPKNAKAATAWPDGKQCPGPPSVSPPTQCGT